MASDQTPTERAAEVLFPIIHPHAARAIAANEGVAEYDQTHVRAAEALAADGLLVGEVVSTAAEIEQLPPGSVVVDRHDDVWQRNGDYWCSYETTTIHSDSGRRLAKYAPLTVLRRGGAR